MKRLSAVLFIVLAFCLSAFAQDRAILSDQTVVTVARNRAPSEAVQIGPNMVTVRVLRNGKVISEQTNHNIKTTGGVDAIFQAVMNTQPAVFKYLYLSTDSASPAAGDCAAGAANCTLASVLTTNGMAPATGTFAHTNGASTATLTYTWTAVTSSTSNVQKAAICNNVTPGSGTCAFENTFTPVSLNVGDQLQLTWTITIS